MSYIGIDLGGTTIKIGAVSEEGQIIVQTERPTGADRPFEDVIRDMADGIKELQGTNSVCTSIAAIGVGVPGGVNNETGHVYNCNNLGWLDVPFRDEMAKYFDCPILLDNDANVAALAENTAGVSKGCSSSVLITLGTGVGSGIVIDGKIFSGVHGVAGEIGHMTLVPDGIPCTCGRRGCVERYCSATSLIEAGRTACLRYADNAIARKVSGNLDKITAKIVIDAAKEGDLQAKRIVEDYAKKLANVIENTIVFLDPEMIVLGGGVSRAGDYLLDMVKSYLPTHELGQKLSEPKIALASLGNDAGIIGAAMLGKE